MITIEVRFFGTFRRYDDIAPLHLNVAPFATIDEVRGLIAAALSAHDQDFDPKGIFAVTALATDSAILPADYVFEESTRIALIPPVSGG